MNSTDWQLDWDEAFDNMQGHDPQRLLQSWQNSSEKFKAKWSFLGELDLDLVYGKHSREKYDIFKPSANMKGTVIFIHGGYWMRTGREDWAFLAEGILANNWAFAIPSYPLAPEVRISSITSSISQAVERIAAITTGPLKLIGHSAGGHLVSRLICKKVLGNEILQRIEKAISVSGIHDLRPLLNTQMNEILGLTHVEAEKESSVFFTPENIFFTCWVGANERPEFLRQNRLLQEAWLAHSWSKPQIEAYYDKGHDHFSVIEQLADKHSPLVKLLTD